MRSRNGSNVLLVEILIAVLFFMLSATVLVQVFATAHNMTRRSGVETLALAEAQNIAETLYAADDMDAALEDMGFVKSHGAWSRGYKGNLHGVGEVGDTEGTELYSIYVSGSSESTDGGELWTGSVSAFYSMRDPDSAHPEDEELFSLPLAHYKEVG